MLTDKDKEHIKDLLKLMTEEDVKLLAMTVTQNMILPLTVEEAVNAILLHSPTTESLLLRKRMSKELLFRYLHEKKIPSVPTFDKRAYILRILQFWKDNTRETQLELQQNISLPSNAQSHEVNELAYAFTNWFYSMLNQQGAALEREHFWHDCNMCLTVTSDMGIDKFEAYDNTEVVKLLFKSKFEHNLYFNPNMSSQGVRGKVDIHGLVMVLVCGTLHQQEKCVGVFEHLFGLIRDPSAGNNWKIKKTQLHLKSSQLISRLPTLEEGSILYSMECA